MTVATEDEIRQRCVAYLSELFDLPPEQVATDENFARFGLDSAMAVEFAFTLEDWLQIEILADALYEYPTVNELARYLAGRLADA
jgi:acyl carrier protein